MDITARIIQNYRTSTDVTPVSQAFARAAYKGINSNKPIPTRVELQEQPTTLAGAVVAEYLKQTA